MSTTLDSPKVLLIHTGELADVRDVLAELGVDFAERSGSVAPRSSLATGSSEPAWSLVIATPQQLGDFNEAESGSRCRRLAITDSDSRTLRALLRRLGVDLVARRPFHPSVLRLLVLHALYRGPERRASRRVSVGVRVGVRIGWRSEPGILVDASLEGCHLLARRGVAPGKRISLIVPAMADRPRMRLKCYVLRSGAVKGGDFAIFARFEELAPRIQQRLRQLVDDHVKGPAVLDEATAPSSDSAQLCETSPEDVACEGLASEDTASEAIPECGDAGEACPQADSALAAMPASSSSPEPDDSPEFGPDPKRRRQERKPFFNRVIALDEQAAQVLLGRDISMGGMRVDSNASLAVGEELRLAVHSHIRGTPLVLSARVERDDGDEGMILRFLDLSCDVEKALAETVRELPTMDLGSDSEGGAQLLVSEIVAADGK